MNAREHIVNLRSSLFWSSTVFVLLNACRCHQVGGRPPLRCITFDGRGDFAAGKVFDLAQGKQLVERATTSMFDSIGLLWAFVTATLGFKPFRHEGKLTGLAARGDPVTTIKIFQRIGFRERREPSERCPSMVCCTVPSCESAYFRWNPTWKPNQQGNRVKALLRGVSLSEYGSESSDYGRGGCPRSTVLLLA